MSWLLPAVRPATLQRIAAGRRSRAAYFRHYNRHRRRYLTRKAREYRAR